MEKIKKIQLLIIMFGLVSLFGDLIYESAKSINGQYLLLLGASASIIGFFSGLTELLSNFLRFVFGFASDKTKKYWFFIIFGYFLLISIPLLALAKTWQVAFIFILFERIGKAIRGPARDTIVSFLTKKTKNIGFSFGIIELLDQVGALIGPIILGFLFLVYSQNQINIYRFAYSILSLPFIILIFVLFLAYSYSRNIKIEVSKNVKKERLTKIFWFYTLFSFFTFLGFINFAILGYHFKLNKIFPDYIIVFLYSLAMLSDALIAPFIGKIYDRVKKVYKVNLLFIIPSLSILIPFFIFSESKFLIIIAILLYGFVIGTQETIMRAFIADVSPISKRGIAYGIYSFILGASLFIGSSLIGYLYEISLTYLTFFIVFSQTFSMTFLIIIRKLLTS
ncbi:MAG: MFS transporter [Candidatus Aenigmatarchaeota archaeon]